MRLKALDREADRSKSSFATTLNPAMPEDFKQHRKVEHLDRVRFKNFQPQNRIGVGKTLERWENGKKTDSSISQAGKSGVVIPGDLTFDICQIVSDISDGKCQGFRPKTRRCRSILRDSSFGKVSRLDIHSYVELTRLWPCTENTGKYLQL